MVIFPVAVVGLLILGSGSGSGAGDGKAEYEQGSALFKAGDYPAALPLFEAAYEHSSKRPSTIRGLAQCERALMLYDRAILHFKEYLAAAPHAEDKDAIEQTIWLIETQKKAAEDEAKEKARASAPLGDPPRLDPPLEKKLDPPPLEKQAVAVEARPREEEGSSIVSSPWFWIVLGAAAIAGGIAAGVALSSSRDPKYDGGTTNTVLHL